MQVRIKKIVYPGKSLAELEGKVVFTDAGLPGEVVEVEPVRERSSFIEARTVAVVEPSPRRVEPRCGHYKACSPWQDMEYALQLEVKGGQVREIFARELKLELAGPEVVPSPKIWGYRNRARFHILRDGRRGARRLPRARRGACVRTDRAPAFSSRTRSTRSAPTSWTP